MLVRLRLWTNFLFTRPSDSLNSILQTSQLPRRPYSCSYTVKTCCDEGSLDEDEEGLSSSSGTAAAGSVLNHPGRMGRTCRQPQWPEWRSWVAVVKGSVP